jgi:hypothetical protein
MKNSRIPRVVVIMMMTVLALLTYRAVEGRADSFDIVCTWNDFGSCTTLTQLTAEFFGPLVLFPTPVIGGNPSPADGFCAMTVSSINGVPGYYGEVIPVYGVYQLSGSVIYQFAFDTGGIAGLPFAKFFVTIRFSTVDAEQGLAEIMPVTGSYYGNYQGDPRSPCMV